MSDECRRARDLVVREVTGAAEPAEREFLQGHAAGCASCAGEMRRSARVWELAGHHPVPSVEAGRMPETVLRSPARARVPISGRIAMAAALFAAVGILWFVGIPQESPRVAGSPQDDPEAAQIRRLADNVRSDVPKTSQEARTALLKIGPRAIPFLVAELAVRPEKEGRAALQALIGDIEADARAAALPKTWPGGTYALLSDAAIEFHGFWSTSIQAGPDGTLVVNAMEVLGEGKDTVVHRVTIHAAADRFLSPLRIQAGDGTDLHIAGGRITGTWGKEKIDRPFEGHLAVPELLLVAAAILPRVPNASREFVLIHPGLGELRLQPFRIWTKGPSDELAEAGPWAFATNPVGRDGDHEQIDIAATGQVVAMSSAAGVPVHPKRLSTVPATDADAVLWDAVDLGVSLQEGKPPSVEEMECYHADSRLRILPTFESRKEGPWKIWANGEWVILDGKGVHLNGRKILDAGTPVRIEARGGVPTRVIRR